MNTLQNLLSQVLTITKKNAELLDANGGRFNLFQMLGVDHYENTHSAILAEFLNPRGSHGLKHKFLLDFINILKIDDFDSESANIRPEYTMANGRIDILIRDKNNKAIIIENKIYAQDQWEQLKRYNEFALTEYGKNNYKIVYLTLNGGEASENSAKNVDYVQLSYRYEIIDWLELCVNSASRFPLVRETLIQYINHIKKLTNQDMNTMNKEEIVKLLISNDNLEAAFTISQNITAVKKYIIFENFNNSLEEIAKEMNLEAIPIDSNEIYAGFGFKVPDWKYFNIYFEFDGSDFMKLGYMFVLIDKEKKCGDDLIKTLQPFFKRHNNNSSIPLGWTYLSKYQDWNLEALKAILSGEMKNEIKAIVIRLFEISKQFEM